MDAKALACIVSRVALYWACASGSFRQTSSSRAVRAAPPTICCITKPSVLVVLLWLGGDAAPRRTSQTRRTERQRNDEAPSVEGASLNHVQREQVPFKRLDRTCIAPVR